MRKSGLSSPPSRRGELVFEAPLICQRRQIAFAIEREIRGEIADDRRRVAGEHLERVRLVPQERYREEERIASWIGYVAISAPGPVVIQPSPTVRRTSWFRKAASASSMGRSLPAS